MKNEEPTYLPVGNLLEEHLDDLANGNFRKNGKSSSDDESQKPPRGT